MGALFFLCLDVKNKLNNYTVLVGQGRWVWELNRTSSKEIGGFLFAFRDAKFMKR